MARKILVLSDSLTLRREAVQYSIELATRMEASLVILLLLPLHPLKSSPNEIDLVKWLDAEGRQALDYSGHDIREAGVELETEVRIGNPRSELLKYLAESDSYQTIVWGSRTKAIEDEGHWLARVKDSLECTIVVPAKKT